MNGMQKSIYEAVSDLARKVGEGAYGRDDDFDADAFYEDFQEMEDECERWTG